MFVAVGYKVKKPEEFLEETRRLARDPPEEIGLAQVIPTKQPDVMFAVWEAPSVKSLQQTLNSELQGLSEQQFYEVDEELARTLEREVKGSA